MRNFLDFLSIEFFNDFMVKNNFSEPKNHQKLNISRPISIKKNFAHRFVGLICTNKPEESFFFFENFFFQGPGAFFTTAKPLFWALFFNFILLFKGDYLIL